MDNSTYLSTLRVANTLIKISTILTIMGVIAMKTGFLGSDSSSKENVKTTVTANAVELASK